MGRLSNQAKLDQAAGWADVIKTSAEAATGTAKFLTEEGLWMGMSIDIFMITGEIKPDNPFLFAQREALAGMFDTLEKLATTDIPVIKDVNPIGLIYKFIKPLAGAVKEKVYTGQTIKTYTGVKFTGLELPTIETPLGDWGLTGFINPGEIPVPVFGEHTEIKYDYYYPALPIQYRILLALFVPGILRLIFNFLSSQLKGGSAFSKLL